MRTSITDINKIKIHLQIERIISLCLLEEYIKAIKDVTTIFPSITFASWASIFTGKMPNETGITGNEYFARDLYSPTSRYNQEIPGISELPSGIVTLDAGAFDPGGTRFVLNHVIPVEFSLFGIYDANNTLTEKLNASAPQRALIAVPLWGEIRSMIEQRYQTSRDVDVRCDRSAYECRTVSMLNQYTDGVDMWGTPDSAWQSALEAAASMGSAADIMDRAAAGESVDFIGHYFDRENPAGERKRFPALFSVYFSGLDHDAHAKGLSDYKDFLIKTTDQEILKVVNALKHEGEFDNKIFIITADHGHTEMPTNLTYKDKNWLGMEVERPAEMSCKLKLDFVDPDNPNAVTREQLAELNNNNLHIWELGEMLKAVGEYGLGQYKVLAPKEIAELYKKKDKGTKQIIALSYGATDKVETADIIVGFNGPMAHVYVADITKLGEVAEVFRLSFESHTTEAAKWWDMDELDYLDFKENMIGRLKESIDKILVRIGQEKDSYYCVFDGLNDDKSIKCADTDPFASMDYVNAWERIEGMNNPDRSGDIVLIMKDKTTSNAIERYTTGTACKSWHGSLNPSDSYVPFIVAYPGGNKKEVEDILQRDALCKVDYSGCRGNWKVTDIIKEIIKEQYQ